MPQLTHVDPEGAVRMVDVSGKPIVWREAEAAGEIRLQPATLDLIDRQGVAKGNVLATARIAGIQAAKRTGELIPLCHPLPIDHCDIDFETPVERDCLRIRATVRVAARTGVEMEALTAVTVAALTVYDMCKSVDREMTIGGIHLVRKAKGAG